MTAALQVTDIRHTELVIPLREAFRHASAERAETSSLWVEVHSTAGRLGCGESCPRPYVTGETIGSAREFVEAHTPSIRRDIHDVDSLRRWVAAHASEIDANPAAWCAVELALWDVLGREVEQPVETLLGLPRLEGRFQYTAVIGDADQERFVRALARYRAAGFTDLKIKLSGDRARDRSKFDALRLEPGIERVRLDANNVWGTPDEAVAALRALEYDVFAVEEPIRANEYAGLARIAAALETRVVLDESVLRAGQIAALPPPAAAWLVNVRVSKMGGLVRSLAVVEAARAAGLGVIVGAQVGETSLLTRAGLTVAHAARGILVAQEGAFGTHLLERDVCEPPLMFGAGGVLDADMPMLHRPGLGGTWTARAAGV